MRPRFRVQTAVQTSTTRLELPFYPPALRNLEQISVTHLRFFDTQVEIRSFSSSQAPLSYNHHHRS